MRRLSKCLALFAVLSLSSAWGFFSHQQINRLAVFALPPEMSLFYKKNIQYITEAAVNPDRRRYTVPAEAPRHYIDLNSDRRAVDSLPWRWHDAVVKFGEDSLTAHGIVPWQIQRMFLQLQEAFMLGDPKKILRLSAELGHYTGDAHVPLHTTSNYDGQKTNQSGIHAFWESRLPELYFTQYDFFVGKASYIADVKAAAWEAVRQSHAAVDSVLCFEKELFREQGSAKFNFETKGNKTVKVISSAYAYRYHKMLAGMVERRMRASIRMTANLWYTAWVNAGQPDLKALLLYTPTEAELTARKEELKLWKEKRLKINRPEEDEDQ